MKERKIIHVDMDQFFAAVEQRDNPELKGKPVAVGWDAERGVVSTASYEARRYGVHSAQSIQVAKRLCPQLIIVPPHFSKYKEVSSQIHSIFHDYTDLIEPLSLDEAFLDVTENKKDIVMAVDIAKEIKQRIKDTTGLTASAGVRFNAFSPLGGSLYYDIAPDGSIDWYYNYKKNQIVKTHTVWEPRASLNYAISPFLSLKAAYARTSQNIHALRNQSTSTPFDRYTISSNIVEPEIADQVSAGLFAMTPDETYDFSVEGYYRKIKNVLDYRDGKTFRSEIEIERLVLPGEGKAYGVELLARKNSGRLTGWLAYTLSWSRTRIDGINGGQWYDANNDRRHDINIVAMYRLSKRWTLNAAWVFNSGQAFTAPSGKYQVIDNWIYYYSERNGYRAPDYRRLDVSAVLKNRGGRSVKTEWVFGIYNIYNRYNPFLINFEDSQNGARTKAKQYSLFGIVPSVSFNVRF